MQLSYGFFHAIAGELFGAEPPDTALPDIAKGKNVLAERLLSFIETSCPYDITPSRID